MLDDDTTAPAANDDLPRPPAGRRSARRPAGPPAPRPEPAATEPPAVGAADAPEPPAMTAEPEPGRRAPRTRKATAARPAEDVPDTPAAEVETPARRRTRKAAPAADQAPVGDDAEAPASRRRASRSRKVAEPAPSTQPQGDVPEGVSELALPELPLTADPFAAPSVMTPAETEAVLADLTRAISGAAEPVVDEDDEELAGEAEEDVPADEEPDDAGEASHDEGSGGEASDDEADEEESGEEESGEEEAQPRRRRRRRGGRRRRRDNRDGEDGEDGNDDDAASQGEDGDAEASDSEAEDDDAEGAEPSEDGGTRRRRRRRRRRGEGTEGDDDPDTEVVVRVREPRRSRGSDANDEVHGIEGSTRLEAKRQRRREGRAAGRRRAPILSEAEFLARRESVERTMVIRQQADYTQIGVVEDGVLAEHYVDRASSTTLIGNIYLGRVQNVLPSMEAAFIDIGRGRNAVLYAGEVDWDAFGADGSNRKMENVFKSGQSVLVQVTKDPVGQKGARLTSHLSLPGRYIVFSPGGELSGISRKLADTERARLKEILGHLIDEQASVIVRTAAEGVSEEELVRDVNRLNAQWESIQKKSKTASAPALLYSEPDATVRIVRDLFTEDFAKLIVDGNGGAEDAYDTIEAYVGHVAPHLAERLQKWDRNTDGDLFAKYRIDEQIAKALERKVFLPSGGSLVIDRTEAMTVIDVNTGKFTGTGGNLEATVTSNNLEAAEEIVRQLRLRDIGGIIVIDFIDMVLPSNRELLLRRLVECLGRDRTRHQVAEVTSLGLVQMTRKKIGTGLAEAFTVECEVCKGRGYHRHAEPVETQAPADGGDRSERRAANRRDRGGKRKGKGKSDEAGTDAE